MWCHEGPGGSPANSHPTWLCCQPQESCTTRLHGEERPGSSGSVGLSLHLHPKAQDLLFQPTEPLAGVGRVSGDPGEAESSHGDPEAPTCAPGPSKDTQVRREHFTEVTTKTQGCLRWRCGHAHASDITPVTRWPRTHGASSSSQQGWAPGCTRSRWSISHVLSSRKHCPHAAARRGPGQARTQQGPSAARAATQAGAVGRAEAALKRVAQSAGEPGTNTAGEAGQSTDGHLHTDGPSNAWHTVGSTWLWPPTLRSPSPAARLPLPGSAKAAPPHFEASRPAPGRWGVGALRDPFPGAPTSSGPHCPEQPLRNAKAGPGPPARPGRSALSARGPAGSRTRRPRPRGSCGRRRGSAAPGAISRALTAPAARPRPGTPLTPLAPGSERLQGSGGARRSRRPRSDSGSRPGARAGGRGLRSPR